VATAGKGGKERGCLHDNGKTVFISTKKADADELKEKKGEGLMLLYKKKRKTKKKNLIRLNKTG